MQEFKPPREPGTFSRSYTAEAKRNKYGDGYSQLIADTLSPWNVKVSVRWDGLNKDELAAVKGFLLGTAGFKFKWNIDGAVRIFSCSSADVSTLGLSTLTATLEEHESWNT